MFRITIRNRERRRHADALIMGASFCSAAISVPMLSFPEALPALNGPFLLRNSGLLRLLPVVEQPQLFVFVVE